MTTTILIIQPPTLPLGEDLVDASSLLTVRVLIFCTFFRRIFIWMNGLSHLRISLYEDILTIWNVYTKKECCTRLPTNSRVCRTEIIILSWSKCNYNTNAPLILWNKQRKLVKIYSISRMSEYFIIRMHVEWDSYCQQHPLVPFFSFSSSEFH